VPRYRYECQACGVELLIRHSISDVLSDCAECGTDNSLKKLLSKPLCIKKTTSNNTKVGDITKKYIEDNREILEQQKKEAKGKDYEPA
jgi:putative FmdB family regulatory protein